MASWGRALGTGKRVIWLKPVDEALANLQFRGYLEVDHITATVRTVAAGQGRGARRPMRAHARPPLCLPIGSEALVAVELCDGQASLAVHPALELWLEPRDRQHHLLRQRGQRQRQPDRDLLCCVWRGSAGQNGRPRAAGIGVRIGELSVRVRRQRRGRVGFYP